MACFAVRKYRKWIFCFTVIYKKWYFALWEFIKTILRFAGITLRVLELLTSAYKFAGPGPACEIPYLNLNLNLNLKLEFWNLNFGTFDLKHNTKHITLCTLHLHFAFDTKHMTLWAHEKALALSLWGLKIWQWSPRSLLGVYLESTRSLLGVYSEPTRSGVTPPKTELETFIFALGFGHRFGTIFGPKLTPNGHPKWTKIDEKLHCILVPSPVPFFEPFFFKISPSSNYRMLFFARFFP